VRNWLVAVIALFAALPAQAAFHLWDIVEAYSNEDGSVQYVEFFTTAANERFLLDHALRTRRQSVVLETFLIPDDLEGSTQDRHLLFATPDFAAAAGIEPDFTIPAGFIELGVADELVFDVVSFFSLAGLPTNGVDALQVGGLVAPASPTNFAGQTGTIVPEPATAWAGAVALAPLMALRRLRRRPA
jgi:serralysin